MKRTIWLTGLIVLSMLGAAWADVSILNQSTGLAIEVPSGSKSEGVQLIVFSNNGRGSQRWRMVPTDGGWFKIVNVNSGLCIGVSNGSKDDGAAVIQWHDDGHLSQQWRWANGGLMNRNSKKMLGTSGNGSVAQGAQLLQWGATGNGDQGWHYVH